MWGERRGRCRKLKREQYVRFRLEASTRPTNCRFGLIRAERTGPQRVFEMPAQPGMGRGDLPDCASNSPRHGRASAFGAAAKPARSPAQPEGPRGVRRSDRVPRVHAPIESCRSGGLPRRFPAEDRARAEFLAWPARRARARRHRPPAGSLAICPGTRVRRARPCRSGRVRARRVETRGARGVRDEVEGPAAAHEPADRVADTGWRVGCTPAAVERGDSTPRRGHVDRGRHSVQRTARLASAAAAGARRGSARSGTG
jgi:hypothetical protein